MLAVCLCLVDEDIGLLGSENIDTILVHHFQSTSTSAGNTSQRFVGYDNRNSSFFHKESVEATQQSTTACQHHPFLGHIGSFISSATIQAGLCLYGRIPS